MATGKAKRPLLVRLGRERGAHQTPARMLLEQLDAAEQAAFRAPADAFAEIIREYVPQVRRWLAQAPPADQHAAWLVSSIVYLHDALLANEHWAPPIGKHGLLREGGARQGRQNLASARRKQAEAAHAEHAAMIALANRAKASGADRDQILDRVARKFAVKPDYAARILRAANALPRARRKR